MDPFWMAGIILTGGFLLTGGGFTTLVLLADRRSRRAIIPSLKGKDSVEEVEKRILLNFEERPGDNSEALFNDIRTYAGYALQELAPDRQELLYTQATRFKNGFYLTAEDEGEGFHSRRVALSFMSGTNSCS